MRSRLGTIPLASREEASAAICKRLLGSIYFAVARVVLAYAPLPIEVDITAVALAALRSGKRLALPRVDWAAGSMSPVEISAWPAELVTTRHGIRQPADHLPVVRPDSIDLVLVPGLAYDLRGGRLGRGAGFYDRFLATDTSVVRIGLAYEVQIVDRIPMRLGGDMPDICMDAVLTERRTVVGVPGSHRSTN